jgi:hypothetical protein
MGNPHGNLAGISDREDPDWMHNALMRVQARQSRSSRKTQRVNGIWMYFDDPFRVLLDEAAQRRDTSLTGYARRATGAFIAHDLDMDLKDVLIHTAKPTRYGGMTPGNMRGYSGRTSDDGEGHGLWIIEGLVTP